MCLLTIVLWLFSDGLLCSERSVVTGEKRMGGCCILCVCVRGAALRCAALIYLVEMLMSMKGFPMHWQSVST